MGGYGCATNVSLSSSPSLEADYCPLGRALARIQMSTTSAAKSGVCRTSRVQRLSEKLKKFWQLRLSPKGFPGLYLTVILLVLVAATWLFGAIAEDVATHDPLTIVDARFNAWLHSHMVDPLTKVMLLISFLHSTLSVTVMTLAVSAYLWTRRLRIWTLTLMLAVFGGMLLNSLLKIVFVRPRPRFDNPILTLTTYSFPSGHTLMATVFYGTLCALALSRASRWQWRALAILGAALLILLVGFSRIYLGVHYLSDVAAAIAEGLAWLAFCLIAVEAIRRRQHRRE
jgi:membrane-associated phospholipid phosphatase